MLLKQYKHLVVLFNIKINTCLIARVHILTMYNEYFSQNVLHLIQPDINGALSLK